MGNNSSNAFSNNSFGFNKKKSSNGLQNSKLDNILKNLESSESDWESKESLDFNIGKKIKENAISAINKNNFKRENKQISNISMLQEARNISKATSNNLDHNKSISYLKNDIPVGNMFECNFFNNERNNSEVSNKLLMAPWTRNKTRIFSIDTIKYWREESDPAFRPSVFNENNQFIPADHYFGFSSNPWTSMTRNNPSNPIFNQNKETFTNLKSPRFADKNIMPPLKTENLKKRKWNYYYLNCYKYSIRFW